MIPTEWELHYQDKFGRRIECDELEVLLRNPDYRIIKQESVDNYFISTVWLGVPHGCPPTQYFETLISMQKEIKSNHMNHLEQEAVIFRYETINEAEVAHEEIVQEYKSSQSKAALHSVLFRPPCTQES